MIGKVALGLWIVHLLLLSLSYSVNNVEASDELRLIDESLDERNDDLIFRSVVNSIHQWELKKQQQRTSGHRHKREVSRVCYEDVGCFEDTGPFSYLEMLPSPPKDVGTRFYVYGSRKARSIPMEVPADNINEKASGVIDPDLPTKVIVHGFGSSCDHVWVYEMRSVLMAVIECNIVCVDWGPGSAVPNYVRAAANTRLVGRQLAKLVRSLNVPLDKVHMIGFSLGAHVAGFAGAELGNVSRITGLDPAGPLFESQDPRARLDETDAHFVDVIHSNGEQLILGGLGSWQPMGDVDFYPNGGRMQTGCSNLFVGAVSDIIWSNPVEGRSLCNHRRAYKLFTDSISPKCRFPAFPCETGYDGLLKGECFPCGTHPGMPCGDMGFYSDKSSARGQLYLLTRDEEPFCAHQYQVKVYNGKRERPVKSYGKLQVTLISDGSINETFTMTKKDDEELHVGATLQRIVVPHPSLTSIDAIEIKYTAYSGWISSGLVSWAIDKVSVTDSYGTTYSFCKRGILLESGRPVLLNLYRGDCSVPPEIDGPVPSVSTVLGTDLPPPPPLVKDEVVVVVPKTQGGIGPFTKEHNYERKTAKDNGFSNEVPQKGLGPFTKEQNIKIASGERAKITDYSSDGPSAAKNYLQSVSPWSLGELANDGNSNSVDLNNNNNNNNEFAERGRGFSSPSLSHHPALSLDRSHVVPVITITPEPADQPSALESGESVDNPSIVHRPLQIPLQKKKESGRSLKLPEITEPVLKPRGTREDADSRPSDPRMEDRKHEVVQADESVVVATTTTPSPNNRGFTVQFLPERLAGILAQAERYARQTLLPLISQYTPSFIGGSRSERPKYFPPLGSLFGNRENGDDSEARRRKKSDGKYLYFEFNDEDSTSTTSTTSTTRTTAKVATTTSAEVGVERDERLLTAVAGNGDKEDEWVPLAVTPLRGQPMISDGRKEKSLAGEWTIEGGSGWSPKNESEAELTETKIDDWVPIVDSTINASSDINNNNKSKDDDRKFIPLVEFSPSISESKAQNASPEPETDDANKRARSIVFPYVYERKNDPRTRYIPLIPEEDLGVLATDGNRNDRKRRR